MSKIETADESDLATSTPSRPNQPSGRARDVLKPVLTLQSRLTFWEGVSEFLRIRNFGLLAIVGFALAIFAVVTLAPLVPDIRRWLESIGFDASHSSKLLASAAIYDVVMGMGLWQLFHGLGLLGRERAAIEQVARRCREYEEQGRISSLSLRGTGNPFVFEGTHQIRHVAQTATYKMAANIREDALGRRFDSINLIVDRVTGDVMGSSSGIRDAQQLGVRLGILGTFIGIVMSLSHVQQIIGPGQLDDGQIQSAIHGIVVSLGAAFATSIAGLAAAILLQLIAGVMRRQETDILEAMERVAPSVQAICRRASEDTPLGVDIEALRAGLKDHRAWMLSHAGDMRKASTTMRDSLSVVAETFHDPLIALQETGQRLSALLKDQATAIGALERMTTTVAELELRVATSFEQASIRAAEVQREGLLALAETLNKATERTLDEIRSGYGQDARQVIERRLDEKLGEAARRLDDAADRQYQSMVRIVTRLGLAMACAAGALLLLAGQTTGVFGWIAAYFGGP